MPKDVPEEKTLEQIGKSLAECGKTAQDNGVTIQLEVHGSETSRLPRIRKMLDYGGNHPASACAGTRTRRTCSTAASIPRSGS